LIRRACTVVIVVVLSVGCSAAADKDSGFESIFDGKSLKGWDGNPKFWSVEDGAITGQTTEDNPTEGNTFIIWRGGDVGDFELKLEYKIIGHNSGVQYRSFEVEGKPWVVGGYQADMEAGDRYSGILYGERFRGILADRGQKTVIGDNHKPRVVGSVGDSDAIQKKIRKEDWNTYQITAKGFHFVQKINGVTTIECTDEDKKKRMDRGILALQLHAGPPMKVQFRNIQLKRLDAKTATSSKSDSSKKKVVFLAGKKSHGYGSHEHKAGCMLLAQGLREGLPGVDVEVHSGGWPKDDSVLDEASTLVIYCDGGKGHPLNQHLDRIDALMKQGVGLVCIHYAVETPKGESGDRFLDWTGGYFEANWSVNPHWMANYKQFPKHPVTRGVSPFTLHDEWYYHMRFREQMEGVVPILTDVPPKSTLNRKDGRHSGNKHVRAKVGQPQHMAWARERSDGGRGFGITGGHFHWNWGHDGFRKLVLNAIAWTAGIEVPAAGVSSPALSVEELEANQDYPQPANHNRARIQKMLAEWNAKQVSAR
jgi:type 1 glutamine amidotransferase